MTNLQTNLQTVYSVQQCSGRDYVWFTSREDAEIQYEKWMQDVHNAFDRGEPAVMQSVLEPDLEGGCYQSWTISDHAMPAMREHPVGTLNGDPIPGIRWGSLATARP